MQLTWLSLLPPLVVIGAMCIMQRLNVSLLIGIISAALIASHGNVFVAAQLCVQKGIAHFSDIDMIFLYALVIVISSLIILLTKTGSAIGCARIMSAKVKTARGGEICAVLLALLLSIDDYLSILTVGLVMGPMTKSLAIAKTKLAYIMRALASPLVIIVPISTWAAAILAQLDVAGVNVSATSRIYADSFYVYLKTIPFVFYSLFTIFSVWFLVISRIGYGPIGVAESIISHDNNAEIDISSDEIVADNHSLAELFLPIMVLMGCVFIGILYAGNYYAFGGNNSFIDAFRHNDKTFLILLLSSSIAFMVSTLLFLRKKMIMLSQIPVIIFEGFEFIKSAIIMVILASILASFLRIELQTGTYLASVLLGKAPLYLLPVLFFIAALIITLMTGSAWGTFSMLIPIATQMLISFFQVAPPVSPEQLPLLFPVLGAVLSGAACGNQLSPFADTTAMTATSAGIDPLEHARTQVWYAIPVIIGTIVSFIIAGLMVAGGLFQSFLVSAGAGVAVIMVLFFVLVRKKS